MRACEEGQFERLKQKRCIEGRQGGMYLYCRFTLIRQRKGGPSLNEDRLLATAVETPLSLQEVGIALFSPVE